MMTTRRSKTLASLALAGVLALGAACAGPNATSGTGTGHDTVAAVAASGEGGFGAGLPSVPTRQDRDPIVYGASGGGSTGDWRTADYSVASARDQVSGWAGKDDTEIRARLRQACTDMDGYSIEQLTDVSFLPRVLGERRASGLEDSVRTLEEAKAALRHATALYCPAYATVFKPEQLQPTGEPDLHVSALSMDTLGYDVPSIIAVDEFNSDDTMAQVCDALGQAKASGENGEDAVKRISGEMWTGSFFASDSLKYEPEARNLQLYSVTFSCPELGTYVGKAIYPGF